MVIGNGLIAREFKQYEDSDTFLIFASGVSHSKSCTPDDFRRERELFTTAVHAHPTKKVVYFSTTSVDDPDLSQTPYVIHKLAMEDLVRSLASQWHIFRLSNLAGASANPSTLLNFFYFNILEHRPFQLWKYSERNIIDVGDVHMVVDHILQHRLFPQMIVNIANPSNYPVSYIVTAIESFTGVKGVYQEIEKGSGFHIDIADVQTLYHQLQMRFESGYLTELLKKYYPPS